MSGTGTVRRAAVVTAGATIMALGLVAPPHAAAAPPATTTSAPASAPTVHTVRTADGGYEIRVGGSSRATVKVSDPAYGVRTAPNRDASAVAVIVDFDGHAGSRLDVLDTATGRIDTVAGGPVGSAAFSQGGELAFVVADDVLVHAAGATTRIGTVDAADGTVELIGWTADGLFVRHHADHTGPPTLSRLDAATGKATTVLASSAGTVYRDFRLVTIDGRQLVSAIRATHVYPCAGEHSALVLADPGGAVVREVGRTSDSYRSAVWSTDGARVGFELQGCVSQRDKAAGRGDALARLDGVNGVYVMDVATGRADRAVTGITANFAPSALDGDTLTLDSSRFGPRTVSPSWPTTAERLDAGTDAAVEARIMPSQFVHQLWDTADDFNGNSACGPTSAVMDLAGYQLANQFSVWVSSPYGHWSPYGGYVSRVYSAYGTTYNAYAPDPNWNYFAGAYGWMVDDPSVGSVHYWLNDYLDRHVSYPIASASYPSASWIRSKIDANLMVVVSGMFAYGRYGHIALITGYTDDGRFYVNDPYGAGTDGSYDGKNTVYTLDYMRGWQFWAA